MGQYDDINVSRYKKSFPGDMKFHRDNLQTKDLDCSYMPFILDEGGKLYRDDSCDEGNDKNKDNRDNWLFMSTVNRKIFAYGYSIEDRTAKSHKIHNYDLVFVKGKLVEIIDVTSEKRHG